MKFITPRIIFTLLVSFCCVAKTFAQKEKERIARYIEQYKDLAIAEMVRTGIPASITLAQGVLETGFGQSDLALNANNHFGIKCKAEWTGETVLHDDDSKGECFRKYPSVEASYKDHSDFLRTRPNYASLFLLDPSDYSGWAKGLKKAGYATNPTYADRLTRIIEENNLQQFTLLALNQKQQGENGNLAQLTTITLSAVQQDKTSAITPDLDALQAASIKKPVYPSGVFIINDTKVLFAQAGTSLFAIANNHRITYSKLIEFNELGNDDILSQDQLIYLEKKPKRGVNEFHTVAANETLHDICQKECVQMASVMEFNHLQKGMSPAVGEKLYLKMKAGTSPKLAMESRQTATSM